MRVIGAITATTVNLRASDSVWRESAPVIPVPPGKRQEFVRKQVGERQRKVAKKGREKKKKGKERRIYRKNE